MLEVPLYNKSPENDRQYVLFTDGSCHIVGKHQKWKAALWSPTQKVRETAEGKGESSQLVEMKINKLPLDTAEQEKWPVLYLYTDSQMMANTQWGWLQLRKQTNSQSRDKPIWAVELWQGIAAWVEKMVVKVCHVDADIHKSQATEEH